MDKSKALELYSFFVNEGYDLGDEQNFISALKDDKKRTELHVFFENEGYDVGDISNFTIQQEELTEEMMETGQRDAAPAYAMTEEKYAAEKKSAGESPLQDGVSADVVEEPVVEEEPVGIFPVEEDTAEEVPEEPVGIFPTEEVYKAKVPDFEDYGKKILSGEMTIKDIKTPDQIFEDKILKKELSEVKRINTNISIDFQKSLNESQEVKEAVSRVSSKYQSQYQDKFNELTNLVNSGEISEGDANIELSKFSSIMDERIADEINKDPQFVKESERLQSLAIEESERQIEELSKELSIDRELYAKEKIAQLGFWEGIGNALHNEYVKTKMLPLQNALYNSQIAEDQQNFTASLAPLLTGGRANADEFKSKFREAEAASQIRNYQRIKDYEKELKDVVPTWESIKDLEGSKILSGAVSNSIQFIGSIMRSVFTEGGSAMYEMGTPMYIDAVEAKAKRDGKTPEEIIYEDSEDELTSMTLGVMAGALEKVGIGQAVGFAKNKILKKAVENEIKSNRVKIGKELWGITKSSLTEVGTEVPQGALEEYNRKLQEKGIVIGTKGSGTTLFEAVGDFVESGEAAETAVSTLLGSMLMFGTGRGARLAISERESIDVDGKKLSFEDFQSFLDNATDEQIAAAKIDIKGNDALKKVAEQKKRDIREDAIIKRDLAEAGITDAGRVSELVPLEKEKKKLQGNTTEAGKKKLQEINAQIEEVMAKEPTEEVITEETKTEQDAIQEPSTETVDVQEPAEGSEEVGEGDVRETAEEKITVTEETQEVTDETLKDLENVPEPVIRGLAVKNLNGETLTEQEQQVFDANQEAVDQMASDIEQAAQAKKEGVEAMGQESAAQAEQRKKDISFQVNRAKRAISKILPNVEIVVHDTMDSFNAAVPPKGKGNRGAFIGNKIHINMSNANTRTVSHEVFHAVVTRALGGGVLGDKAATQLTNKMLAAVERGAGNKVLQKVVATKADGSELTLRDYMNLFAKGEKEGQGYDISLQSEEQLAELVGFLAENFIELDVNAKTAIKAWIGKLAEKLGINKALGTNIYNREMSDKDAIDLLNTIAGKSAKGEIIKEAKTLEEMFGDEEIAESEKAMDARFQKASGIASKIEVINAEKPFLNCEGFCNKIIGDVSFKEAFEKLPNEYYQGEDIVDNDSAINDLSNKLKVGDIVGFGSIDNPRHYAIYMGEGSMYEVEQWGAEPKEKSLRENINEYESVSDVYREKSPRFQKPIKATVDFRSRTGRTFSVSKEFNNKQHLDNYIKFRERKGDKEIGVTIDERKEVEAPKPQKRRFAKKAVINIGNNISGETTLEIGRLSPIMIDGQEFARMTNVDAKEDSSRSERDLYTLSVDAAVSEGLGGIVVPKSTFNEVAVDQNRFDVKKRGNEFVITPKKDTVLTARFQADYTDPTTGWTYLYDKNTVSFKRLEAQGFIKKGMSINDFNGLKMFLHQPDAMFAGQVLNAAGERIARGKGGMYYPILFHEENLFWASTPDAVDRMVQILNSMIEDNGGRILMGITTAPPKKLLSSTTGANAMMDIYSNAVLDDILGLSTEDIKTNLINAANKHLGMSLTEDMDQKQVISKIREELDPDITSFKQRGKFSDQIARDIVEEASKSQDALSKFEKFFLEGAKADFFKMNKKKDGTFAKNAISVDNFKAGISAMMSEPMLKDLFGTDKSTGHIYGVVEVTGPVKQVPVSLIAMNRLTDDQRSAIVKAAMKDGLQLKDRQKTNILKSVRSMFYTEDMSDKEKRKVAKSLNIDFDANLDKTMKLMAEFRGVSKKELIETYAVENYLRKEHPDATGDLADAILAMTENTHESYPMAVQAESGVTLNLFDTPVKWDTVSTDPKNGKVMSDKDYDNKVVRDGKVTTRQDQLFSPSSGISSEPLLINTKNLGEEHQVSSKYQAPASTAFTIYDVINELRGKGYTDSAIALFLSREINPDTQKNFTKKEIKAAMAVPIDIENTLPSAFGDVEGGIAQGQKMFTEVMEKVRRSAARMRPANPAKIRAKAHQILMAHPDFDKQSATVKNRLILGLDSALGTTANKAIQAEISAIKLMIKGGKMSLRELKAAQVRLRALIRKELPNDRYGKSVVNKLLKMVTDATPETMDQVINDVTSVINEQRSEIFISEIETILNQKFERTEAGRKKGTKVTATFADAIAFAKKKLAEIRKAADNEQDFQMMIDKVRSEREELFSKVDMMTEEDVSMVLAYDLIIQYGKTFAENNNEQSTVEALEASLDMAKDLVNTGRGFMKEQLRLAHEAYKEQFSTAFEDITGVDVRGMDKEERDGVSRGYRVGAEQRQNNLKGVAKVMRNVLDRARVFFARNEDLAGFMDILSRGAGDMFGGKLQEMVKQRVDDSSTVYKRGYMEMKAVTEQKAREIFGKKWKRVVEVENRIPIDTGIEIEGRKLIFSQNQMYYLYNMAKDPANHPAFENMWGKDWMSKMEQIEGLMTPEVKEWADWQVNEFYPKMYERYNPVYRRIYRTNLGWNKFYAGRIYRKGANLDDTIDLLEQKMGPSMSVAGSSTKHRVKNNLPIEAVDGNLAMGRYIEEMEKFRAYQETVRDISKLFGNEDIKNAIKEKYGDGFYNLFNTMLERYLTGRKEASKMGSILGTSNRIFLFSKLGYNLSLVWKQLTSVPTYANDIGFANWGANITKVFRNPISIGQEIYDNSAYIQERYAGDFMNVVDMFSKNKENTVSLGAGTDFYINKVTDVIMRYGMNYTKGGDALAIFLGGAPNYIYYKNQFKKNNPNATEQQAIDYAIKKFEKDTRGTQQSSDIQDRDFYQTSNEFVRSMMLFTTSPRQYWRKSTSGYRQLYRKMRGLPSKGTLLENLRTVFTYRFMMPLLYTWATMGFPPPWDLDDEEENDLMWSALLGNISALFMIGHIAVAIKDFATDKPWAGRMPLPPIMQIASDIINKAKSVSRTKDPVKKQQKMDELYFEMLNNGLPLKNLDKSFGNWYRTATGDQEFNVRKIGGYSDYVADKDAKKMEEAMEALRKMQDNLRKKKSSGEKKEKREKREKRERR